MWPQIFVFNFVCLLVSSSKKPNIVILYADDLGYGDLESFGHPTSRSPNITAFASKAKVFTNFYAAGTVCSPSRAALMTGRYPVSVGVYPEVFFPDSLGGLSTSYKTIANVLKESGYATSMVGKWHLGVGEQNQYLPTKHGFDDYFGIPYSQDMCPCPVCFPNGGACVTKCQDPATTVSCPLFNNEEIVEQPVDLTKLTEKYTERAVNVIRNATSKTEPFFLYMAYTHTHTPQFAGSTFHKTSDRAEFGDSLAELDGSIGQIIAALESTGQLENTLIFFSSDNGPSLMQHTQGGSAGLLRCGKGTTYEGGMRLPGIFRYDGKIDPGISHELASTLDVIPTIMSIVGYHGNVTHHGYDLSKLLFDGAKSPRTSFAYYPFYPVESTGLFAVRHDRYKGHFYTNGSVFSDPDNYDHACRPGDVRKHDPPLIFDLNVDPGERYPLTPASPDYNDALKGIMEAKKQFDDQVVWAPSEMAKGRARDANPCCTCKGCSPFPSCCNCPTNLDRFFNEISYIVNDVHN